MGESVRTIVKCQDSGDGSEDILINLPSYVLTALNLGLGDLLGIELVDAMKVLKPVRDGVTKS